jgi:hypothetical protein
VTSTKTTGTRDQKSRKARRWGAVGLIVGGILLLIIGA